MGTNVLRSARSVGSGAGEPGWRRRALVGDARSREEERMVDALASAADEGRGHAAKCPGEALAACDPGISEWGNPPGAWPGAACMQAAGTAGTETSQYREEQKGFPQ